MINKRIILILIIFLILSSCLISNDGSKPRLRDWGVLIGVMSPGKFNAITDVSGVKVGHLTLIKGNSVRTGVTAILPHKGNIFQLKVPAAIYIGNGFGKLAGYSQIEELGNIETPIILTNTLGVPTAADALIDYTFLFAENKNVQSVNPVVGETNDGYLNDIRGRHIKKHHVLSAIKNAKSGPVAEGCVGAGTGTICFGFKGGIGTASRVLPKQLGGYTVGVLVQTNFGGILQVAGYPVGVQLGKYYLRDRINQNPDGSCMIVVATDAPLSFRNLKRLAKRAMLGLAKTGGICSNGSGDYVIAFSTARELQIPYQSATPLMTQNLLRDEMTSPLFLAVIESTEEAILNSLFKARSMKGRNGRQIEALPLERVKAMLGKQ